VWWSVLICASIEPIGLFYDSGWVHVCYFATLLILMTNYKFRSFFREVRMWELLRP
jgi:hypothetical protein